MCLLFVLYIKIYQCICCYSTICTLGDCAWLLSFLSAFCLSFFLVFGGKAYVACVCVQFPMFTCNRACKRVGVYVCLCLCDVFRGYFWRNAKHSRFFQHRYDVRFYDVKYVICEKVSSFYVHASIMQCCQHFSFCSSLYDGSFYASLNNSSGY